MKKILFIISITFLSGGMDGFAQFGKKAQVLEHEDLYISSPLPNKTYIDTKIDKVLEGKVIINNAKDSLRSEGSVKEGYPNGKWKIYKNGKLYQNIQFKDGFLHGEFRQYFTNGKVASIIDFRKGELEGRNMIYYPSGQIKSENHIRDGVVNGTQREYDEEGQLISEAFFVGGVIQGKVTAYEKNEDGRTKVVCFYVDNELDGLYTTYYANGKIRSKGNYKKGKIIGEWEFFDTNGKLKNTINHE